MNLDLFDGSHCLAATEHLNPDLLDVSRCLAATKHLLALIISDDRKDVEMSICLGSQ